LSIQPQIEDGTMYLVLPVPFREFEGELQVESQAANGLDRWAENFARLIVAAPLLPLSSTAKLAGFVWRNVSSLEHRERIRYQPLPPVLSTRGFFKDIKATRRQIAKAIAESHYLQFAISGLIGDWASIAALEAIRLKRKYAVHTDCVEYELIQRTARSSSKARQLRVLVEAPLMKLYHKYILERASLGLLHGEECFRAYAPWCSQGHLIHDIHTKQSDLIDDRTLARKLGEVQTAEVLRLVYAGRLHPMKAPLEWLRAVAAARDKGAKLQATWYGEGVLLDEALAERSRLNLDDLVDFAGFVADRATLLSNVRSAHAVLFTHITPESPRNLLEALVSGTPIVGYDNPYAMDLIRAEGGGALVPIHDYQALGEMIARLATDRKKLASMIEQAARNGRRFSDSGVFAERSALLRQYA
jgi:glycosyltransferase involved in cell wall biosynthesis